MKRALICGMSGQDGAFLAELLLEKGYEVWGTSRDADKMDTTRLDRLRITHRVQLRSMIPTDLQSVQATFSEVAPDEVYLFAGQSSVSRSFESPVETVRSIVLGTLNALEAVRLSASPPRLYNASSSECFGDLAGIPANESTSFAPRSPYGVAKAAAHGLVANYREIYGIYACSGILFNHESFLRPDHFVTQKVARTAYLISIGAEKTLRLGRLDITRDWGWAPEFVDAMWRILQQPNPMDYVIATGHSAPLSEFVAEAFNAVGLDWRDHVEIDASLGRPTDLAWSGADPQRAQQELGWRASITMPEVAKRMVTAHRDGLP